MVPCSRMTGEMGVSSVGEPAPGRAVSQIEHTRPIHGVNRAALLHATVFTCAIAVIGIAASLDPRTFTHPIFLAWVAAIALVDLVPVPAWMTATVGMDLPLCVALAILYPAPVAGAIALVGAIDIRELKREIPLSRSLFNRAQIALATMTVGAVFHIWASSHSSAGVLVPAALAGIAAGYCVNIVLVTTAMSLDYGLAPRAVVTRLRIGDPVEFVLSYLALGLLGVLMVTLDRHLGLWSVGLVLVLVVAARQMFYRSKMLEETTAALRARERTMAQHAQRLEELLEKEQQATSELRELDRMRSEFIAVASHELRSPITGIIGSAKTLRRAGFSEDPVTRDEFVAAIERQAEHLGRLVENLFAANLLERGDVPASVGRVSVDDLCREVLERLGPRAQGVRLDVAEDLPWMVTDRDMVGRILTNLLENALKYSPEDATCEVTAGFEDGRIVFRVRDQGIGIDPRDLPRIFDSFYQADSSTVRRFGGAGLGLYVTKRLVEALGGDVSAASTLGEGSVFTVRLPVAPPAVASEPPTS